MRRDRSGRASGRGGEPSIAGWAAGRWVALGAGTGFGLGHLGHLWVTGGLEASATWPRISAFALALGAFTELAARRRARSGIGRVPRLAVAPPRPTLASMASPHPRRDGKRRGS